MVTQTCDCVIQDRSVKEMLYNVPNTTVFLCKRRTLQFTLFATKVNNMWPNNSKAQSPLPHISVSLTYILKLSSQLHLPSHFKAMDALQTSQSVQTRTFVQLNSCYIFHGTPTICHYCPRKMDHQIPAWRSY